MAFMTSGSAGGGITPTRGERNNNPGNIDEGGGWRGDLGLEIVPPGMSYRPRFARFDTPHNGIRALAKQLLAYQEKHGLRSILAMVNRWAAAGDGNNPESYAGAACNYCRVGPTDDFPLRVGCNLVNLVFCIIRQENGRVMYDAATIAAACGDALI
jgi:hypothetical protein